jgi:tetratricopeptide (TPR) repeat protein
MNSQENIRETDKAHQLLAEQKFEEAQVAYRRAITLDTHNSESYYGLGECLTKLGQLEEAISAYRQAFQLIQAKKNFELGMLLLQQQRFDQALSCYQKALELRPVAADTYSELAIGLVRYGLINKVISSLSKALPPNNDNSINYYHQLAVQLSEKGLIAEAIIVFKIAEKKISPGEIYEQIWKGLNGLSPLDEANPNYHREIDPDAAESYFAAGSKYRYIDVTTDINEDDKIFLTNAGLSMPYLRLMHLDQIYLEEIYINNWSYNPKIQLDKDERWWGHPHQKSIVETGYIYSVCPFTGRIIRTDQSVGFYHAFSEHPAIIYRFLSQEVFYVFYGTWIAEKTVIYLPKFDLILRVGKGYFFDGNTNYYERINRLKAELVSCWKNLIHYISRKDRKNLTLMTGWSRNIGHHLFNELEALNCLVSKDLLNKIDKFFIRDYNYYDLEDIFELDPDRILDTSGCTYRDSLNQILAHNCFVVGLRSNHGVTENLVQKISKISSRKCSEEVWQEIRSSKKHFPLLCVLIRSHNRVWVSQVEGVANIIQSLHSDFPNLGVVFHGWSLPKHPDSRVWSGIEMDQVLVEKIRALIPSSIPTYSAIGRTLHESIMWAHTIDVFVGTLGSGLTYLVWIANKQGVFHGNKLVLTEFSYGSTDKFRENCVPVSFIPVNSVHDYGTHTNDNYDVDWQVVYNELLPILQQLSNNTRDASK